MSRRLGSLGAGASHFRKSHLMPWVSGGNTVTAVYDPSKENLQKTLQVLTGEVAICDSAEELVYHPSVDVICITSLDERHARQLEMAVDAGKPVLCDKPLAVNRGDMTIVRRAIEKAKRKNIPVMSCHAREDDVNTNLPYGWANANLGGLKSKYGNLIAVDLDFSYPAPKSGWKTARSLLLDHATHELGLLRRWVPNGKISVVRVTDGPTAYTMVGSIGEVAFKCVGTRMLDETHGTYPEEMYLRFARATCVINTAQGTVTITPHQTQKPSVQRIELMSKAGYDKVFAAVTQRFIEVLDGKAKSPYDDLLTVNGLVVDLVETGRAQY